VDEVPAITGKLRNFELTSNLDEIRFDANLVQVLQQASFFALGARPTVSLPDDKNIEIAVRTRFASSKRAGCVHTSFA
jgi:hypothetical protein